MLSIFPQILFLSPLGLAVVRVAAGVVMLYIGYTFWGERAEVARTKIPIIGHCPVWLCAIGCTVQIAVGLLLVVGLWTQVVAIGSGIMAIKILIWGGRYGKIIPISRSGAFLLLAISICLIVSGAGSFGFDLPL